MFTGIIVVEVKSMFKKIYIEITNNCNLSCSFCPMNDREKKYISIEEFNTLLNKINGYTKYLYFHIMGEPLMHPNINELINIASERFNINITTNGYLLNRIRDNKNIRQINISLHSYNERYTKSLKEYLSNIFEAVDMLRVNNTIINYRLWINSVDKDRIIHKLEEKYNVEIGNERIKLAEDVYLDFDKEFIWPSLDNAFSNDIGTCMGTRSHIGILVDGTVVPCCLDNNGYINLGNIYKNDLSDIIASDKFIEIKKGFLCNKKVNELCKKCNFYDGR